ncbi:alpha/beta hydrolase [Deinococcus cellulosilyticus]|nr:alpha/beta hydrolase [Deinococcus cellulosilyticus]
MRPQRQPLTQNLPPLSLEEERRLWEEEALKNPLPSGILVEPLEDGALVGERIQPTSGFSGTILYLHGGGFSQGSSKTHRHLAALLALHTGWQVLTLDYPLAPEHPFPQAIDFTVEAYQQLLVTGHPPSQVCFAGDSAGGQIALSALLKARDEGLRIPAGAFFISPWLDLTLSGETMLSLAELDPLVTRDGLQKAADVYLQDHDPQDDMASPLFASLSGLPPMLCLVGEHEVLLSDSLTLADQASEAAVQCLIKTYPEMWHVWPAWGEGLPEAVQAFKDVQAFLESVCLEDGC